MSQRRARRPVTRPVTEHASEHLPPTAAVALLLMCGSSQARTCYIQRANLAQVASTGKPAPIWLFGMSGDRPAGCPFERIFEQGFNLVSI